MALRLAPYNEAMRVGMGFNSYTQSLCVNDVVQKKGGIKASERDLKLRDHAAEASKHAKTVAALEGERTDAAFKEQGIGVGPGTGAVVVHRASVDGQNVVSQVVTWEARFIDNMSDITNKLNISGSLAIKVSGMSEGGGVEGKASFLDEKLFTTGRRNYHIHVKVVNQHLYTDDVTEFVPLKHVQPGQFTDVYGDSYISGFLEGGVFDAVVSFDTSTNTSNWNVGGSIKAHFKTTGVTVSGEAQGGMTENSKKVDMSTDIKVSWSGGGDIKENSITDWDIAGLMKVAMEFPDRVAACPQRINAIITKYTSLRSYLEQTSLGSPLDYENAGIYTSSLLDAYMEYKLLWRTIQSLISDLETNVGVIKKAKALPGLESYAKDMKTAYDQQLDNFTNLQKADQNQEFAIWREKEAMSLKLEQPLPPNLVQPYEADILGFDKARRECRFEMIKIVREVDAVSRNPQVAVDPGRNWQYLTPGIFKLLLPVKSDDPSLPDRKKWEETLAVINAKEERITELQEKVDKIPPPVRAWNNLSPRFDGKTVRFVNPYSLLCMDAGADNSTRLHGWELGLTNTNQEFVLRKTDKNNPDSAWEIMHGSKYLLCGTQKGQPIIVSTSPGSKDYQWLIGCDAYPPPGVYTIRSSHTPFCALRLVNLEKKHPVNIESADVDGMKQDQQWLVIVK